MKLACLSLALSLAACGSASTSSDGPTGGDGAGGGDAAGGGADSAGGTDGGGGGADAANTVCSHTQPFETVTDVLGVNTSENNENNARLSHDEMTIIFGRKGTSVDSKTAQFIATRTTRDGAFGTPTPLFSGGPSGFDEFSAWLTDDQLGVFWDTPGFDINYKILFSSRSSTSVQFSHEGAIVVENVNHPNSLVADLEPFVVPSVGMYLVSNRDGNTDMYFAPSNGSGGFMAASALTALNTVAGEELPTPSNDGLALYFYGGDRAPGGMSADVWLSTRATTSDTFTTSTRDLGAVNTAGYEYPTWLSDDNCRLYITANDSSGVQNVRVATRTPQ